MKFSLVPSSLLDVVEWKISPPSRSSKFNEELVETKLINLTLSPSMIARFGSINLEKFDKLRNFSSDETDDRISTVYFFLGNVSFRFSSRPSRIKSWKDLYTIKISLVSLNKIIEAISFVCYNVYYNDKKEGVIFVFPTKMASFSHQLLAQKDTLKSRCEDVIEARKFISSRLTFHYNN